MILSVGQGANTALEDAGAYVGIIHHAILISIGIDPI